jgi:N-methylhydantoinase A/oxoprolinase/acetone carboxylase beta subunit
VLVAYGGAAPAHAAFYGGDIGAKAILVPADSTVFSAEGMLTCDLVRAAQVSRTLHSPFVAADRRRVEEEFALLEQQVVEEFAADGVDVADLVIQRVVGVRYVRQTHTIELALGPDCLDGVRDGFEASYGRMFGAGAVVAGGPLEVHALRAVATRPMPELPLQMSATGDSDPAPAWRGTRDIFTESGTAEATVYDGDALASGHRIEGPAIIQRMGDTVVVPDGFSADVDSHRALWLRHIGTRSLAPVTAAIQEQS